MQLEILLLTGLASAFMDFWLPMTLVGVRIVFLSCVGPEITTGCKGAIVSPRLSKTIGGSV